MVSMALSFVRMERTVGFVTDGGRWVVVVTTAVVLRKAGIVRWFRGAWMGLGLTGHDCWFWGCCLCKEKES